MLLFVLSKSRRFDRAEIHSNCVSRLRDRESGGAVVVGKDVPAIFGASGSCKGDGECVRARTRARAYVIGPLLLREWAERKETKKENERTNERKAKLREQLQNKKPCLFYSLFLYFLVVLSVYTERDPHQSIIAQVFCAL